MIYEYQMGIYPRRLWVTFDATPDELNDMFPSGGTDDKPFVELPKYANADVNRVVDNNKHGGFLVRFFCREVVNMGIVAHESNHIADEVWDYIGAEVDLKNNEPHSYLVGWVASRIEDSLKTKIDLCKNS